MADLNQRIGPDDGLVAGDSFDVVRTVTDLPAGRTVERAWITVKRSEADDDAEAVFQKEITTADVAAQGVISEPGTGSGSDRHADMRFRLQPSETSDLTRTMVFDIQVELDDDTINTPFKGTIEAEGEVTRATS